jgi:branched-chain amino acid transport system permease protein
MSLADQSLQYLLTGVSVGMVYGVVGLGLTIIFNATGIINFAQGEFVMLGGMTAVALTAAEVPLPAAVVLAVAVVTIVGAVVERVAIRPMRGASVITLIIATIGASLVLKGGAKLLWGPDAVKLPAFSGETPIRIGEAGLDPQRLWVMGLAALGVLAVQLFFKYTLTGKAMWACAINRPAARLAGISADRMVSLSFAMSAALAALGGVVLTPVALMHPTQGTHYTLTGFLAAVLGGLGSGLGAVLGGIVLGIVESFAAGFISSGYSKGIAVAVALIVLWRRPEGLVGRRQD